MDEKKCVVKTIRRGNVIETVIESNSPKLDELCDKLRASKMQKLEKLRSMESCAVNIQL